MKYFIYALLIGIIIGVLKYIVKPIVKGIVGEKVVSAILIGLPSKEYILLNDVMLETKTGSTQIDHVLISIYGIFVIETKNYKGFIYGKEYADEWTQNIYGRKIRFRNPLKQNYGHVAELMKLLSLDKEAFIPIVAFAGTATLRVKSNQPVIYMGAIKKTVLKYKEKKFSEEEIIKFSEIIKTAKLSGNIANRVQHVKNIKENLEEAERKVEEKICPKCGGNLLNKKGKYGIFIGCSNYPECKYTKKMD